MTRKAPKSPSSRAKHCEEKFIMKMACGQSSSLSDSPGAHSDLPAASSGNDIFSGNDGIEHVKQCA